MPVQHINRRGDTYYLHQGTTKTGKPKWFFSKKAEGTLAETIPAGYEVYENHDALVFLRVIVPVLVTKAEIKTVEEGVRKLAKLRFFLVEAKGESIIVYTAEEDKSFVQDMLAAGFGITPGKYDSFMQKSLRYMPMMRFTLIDEIERLYTVERWCYRGAINDWIHLSRGELSVIVKKYTPHLGKESFYDLM